MRVPRGTPVVVLPGAPVVILRGAPVVILRGAPVVVPRGAPVVVLKGVLVVDRRVLNDLRRPAPFLVDDPLLEALQQACNGQQSGPDSRSHPSPSGTRGLGHAADRFG
jgi:hypothetical protein